MTVFLNEGSLPGVVCRLSAHELLILLLLGLWFAVRGNDMLQTSD